MAEMTSTKVFAPWSEIQVKRLNEWQLNAKVHPFTCGSGNRKDTRHKDGEGVLIATRNGWICPFCTYKQDWAFDIMMVRA